MAVKGNKLTPRCREAEVAEKVRLGDVCSIVYGERIRKKDSVGGAYPVYGGGGETFRWPTFNRENKCVVSRFAMSKECVRFVSGKFFLNDSGLTVETKDDRSLLQYYLDWFLFGNQDKIYSLGQGAAQKNLEISRFINLKIPLPPLPAQRRIAAELDKICELKKNAETRLEELDLLVKSRFVEMFGDGHFYPKEKVEDVAKRVKVAFVGSCDQFYTTPEYGVPMVRTTNLTKDGFSEVGMKYVTREFHMHNKKSQLHNGDILVARHGANGRACLYDGGEANCLNVIIIEPDLAKVMPVFLVHALNSDCVRKEIQRDLVGSTQHVLNTNSFAKAIVPLPPLALQREFAAFVEKVDKLRENVRETVAKMDVLYRSKLQEYFG